MPTPTLHHDDATRQDPGAPNPLSKGGTGSGAPRALAPARRHLPPSRDWRAAAAPFSVGQRAVLDPIARDMDRWRRHAERRLSSNGFSDIAADAVALAFMALVWRFLCPDFTVPTNTRAWIYAWSSYCAHAIRRNCDRFDTVSLEQVLEARALVLATAAEGDASSPDAGLVAAADEAEFADWVAQVALAEAALLPQDREALKAEVARRSSGEPATAGHRKRLERARGRATRVLARFGIRGARPPAKPR